MMVSPGWSVCRGDLGDGGPGGCLAGAAAGEVVADDGVAAVVAEGLDLEEQAPDAAAGAVIVLVEVGLERVELAGARSLPPSDARSRCRLVGFAVHRSVD